MWWVNLCCEGVSLRWHLIDERFQWCEIAARQMSRGIFCWLVCYCNLQRQLDEFSSYLDGIWLRLTSNVGSVRINSLTFGESLRCLGWCWFSCLEQCYMPCTVFYPLLLHGLTTELSRKLALHHILFHRNTHLALNNIMY